VASLDDGIRGGGTEFAAAQSRKRRMREGFGNIGLPGGRRSQTVSPPTGRQLPRQGRRKNVSATARSAPWPTCASLGLRAMTAETNSTHASGDQRGRTQSRGMASKLRTGFRFEASVSDDQFVNSLGICQRSSSLRPSQVSKPRAADHVEDCQPPVASPSPAPTELLGPLRWVVLLDPGTRTSRRRRWRRPVLSRSWVVAGHQRKPRRVVRSPARRMTR